MQTICDGQVRRGEADAATGVVTNRILVLEAGPSTTASSLVAST
jgi:hypothetical protein